MNIKVFYFDPLAHGAEDDRRQWRLLLGEDAKECAWRTNEFVVDETPITEGVVVAHASKLLNSGIPARQLEAAAKAQPNLTIIIVSGSPQNDVSQTPNVYYRKTWLSNASNDPFRACFRRFLEHLHLDSVKTPDYKLLEPFIPSAVALDILCQAHEIAHSSEANCIPSSEVSKTEKASWWLSHLGRQGASCCDLTKEMKDQRVPDDLIELVKSGLCPGNGSITANWVGEVREKCAPLVGYEQS